MGAYGKEALWSFISVTHETAALPMLRVFFCALFRKETKHDLGPVIVGSSSMYVN